MFTAQYFFDLTNFSHSALFTENTPVWNCLTHLKNYINSLAGPVLNSNLFNSGTPLTEPLLWHNNKLQKAQEYEITYGDATKKQLLVKRNDKIIDGASIIMAGVVLIGNRINLGRGVLIESGAFIKEPAIIEDFTEVRQSAYLRGYCLVGKRCVVGHATEVKHSIFLDDAKAGHFAYIGDSILGNDTNLGAGTKMANLRFLAGDVGIKTPEGIVSSGLRKLGAILGDRVQTGCNSVTNPGTLIGPDSMLMPNTTSPSGFHPAKSVIR